MAYVQTNTLARDYNGLGARTEIVNLAKTALTPAELHTILNDMQLNGFTIAAVGTADGTPMDLTDEVTVPATDTIFSTNAILIALQSGPYTAEGTNAHGVTGAVTTVIAVFG